MPTLTDLLKTIAGDLGGTPGGEEQLRYSNADDIFKIIALRNIEEVEVTKEQMILLAAFVAQYKGNGAVEIALTGKIPSFFGVKIKEA